MHDVALNSMLSQLPSHSSPEVLSGILCLPGPFAISSGPSAHPLFPLQSLVPQGLQSVEQIEEVVQQATKVTAWPGWPQQT